MTPVQLETLKPVRPRLATGRAITALVLREMSTTYGRSPGGYLWAILEPAAGITLLVIIFSLAFRAPPLGTSFAIFYASGLLPFMLFMDIVNKLSQAIQFSRQLLEYPRVTFLDALAARLILNSLTQLMVHTFVLSFIFVVLKPSVSMDFSKVLLGYGVTILLAAGIGTMNGFLTLSYPLWQTIWSITTRPLLIVSGIIFLFETVPQPYQGYLWYNPLVHVIALVRDGYYPFYHPSYASVFYVVLVAFATGMSGLFLLRRYHKDMLLK